MSPWLFLVLLPVKIISCILSWVNHKMGRKQEIPKENHLTIHKQNMTCLTWPELGSNPQRWDDEWFRVLKISILNHSATGTANGSLYGTWVYRKINPWASIICTDQLTISQPHEQSFCKIFGTYTVVSYWPDTSICRLFSHLVNYGTVYKTNLVRTKSLSDHGPDQIWLCKRFFSVPKIWSGLRSGPKRDLLICKDHGPIEFGPVSNLDM